MGTDPHQRIVELSSRRRALLKHVLSRSGDPGVLHAGTSRPSSPPAGPASLKVSAPIPAVSRDGPIPVSPAQQRLWFLDQLESGSSSFNIAVSYRFRGALNVAALERSLQELLARHESLRTTFDAVDGQPAQVITSDSRLKMRFEDLQSLPEPEREATALSLVNEDSHRPFNLARGPLIRATVLGMDPEDHVLTLVIHHIVSDAWSFEVLNRNLEALYHAISNGTPPDLPPLPIQYADFASWQRDSMQGNALESELSYWKRTLDGLDPLLDLPTDHPRPPTRSERGARRSVVLPPALAEQLRELGRQCGTTLFTVLLAALQTLLHRYTGREDIAVGTSVAGRSRAETEELIGFFVNTLVLRTSLSGNPTVAELLARASEVTLGAFAHQEVPFDRLVEELQPERDPSRSPLIQVMFTAVNAPRKVALGPDISTTHVEHEVRTARFDLTLYVSECPDGLDVRMEYSTDLFRSSTIARMLEHFRMLLEQMVADSAQKISSLKLLTPFERQQLLGDWNETETTYPLDRCLHGLFEEQVHRTPEAVAVASATGQLTYRQLNRRANRLARRLREAGLGSEALIGLCLERSPDMVVGLLGILKAGGAYVPMDPTYPLSRLSFILTDTRAPVLVTTRSLLATLPPTEARVLFLDDDDLLVEDPEDDEGFASIAAPNHLAYVIYTSGSTGSPKGVLIEHRSVVNYVLGFLDRIRLDQPASFAMVQPLTVDSSVSSIYPPLLTGGCLHVISREQAIDPEAFSEYAARHPIDVLKIAPSHLAVLLTAAHPERILPRRSLIIGGEASRRDWAEGLRAIAPDCAIYNHYGPTEATVGVCTWPLEAESSTGPTLPIGRALPNVRLYVLDQNRQPQPVGVPGELYCGGSCLARGYLNLADATSEQFIQDPFHPTPDARLYRTGDLVRWQPDGNLEFLGRADHQVKIRGYRVEPGEIESALTNHPDVRDAVVVVRTQAAGDDRLVGYIVPRDGNSPKHEGLLELLRGRLPDYMVPSAFVVLPELPRTPHGKVDRGALPAPDEALRNPADAAVAPRNDAEERMRQVWERVLAVQSISVTDSFFLVGGHSLLAVTLLSEIEKEFGIRVPLARFFDRPTVEGLALAVSDPVPARRPSLLVVLQAKGSKPPLFCVPGHDNGLLGYANLARCLPDNQPVIGLARPDFGEIENELGLEEIAARYVTAIRERAPDGPYLLSGYCFGGYVAREMARQLAGQGQNVSLLAMLECFCRWWAEGQTPAALLRMKMQNLLRRSAFHAGAILSGGLPYLKERISKVELRRKEQRDQEEFERHLAEGVAIPEHLRHVRFANTAAADSYRPKPYAGPVILIGASTPRARTYPTRLMGWDGLLTGDVDVHMTSDNLQGLLAEPVAPKVASHIQAAIAKALVVSR
jgi:amino acid adenylation domain-containing protein